MFEYIAASKSNLRFSICRECESNTPTTSQVVVQAQDPHLTLVIAQHFCPGRAELDKQLRRSELLMVIFPTNF